MEKERGRLLLGPFKDEPRLDVDSGRAQTGGSATLHSGGATPARGARHSRLPHPMGFDGEILNG